MRCEDYPCCGHTDGLGCDWTYTPEARAYDIEHAYCDHENGFCETMHDEWDDEDDYDPEPYVMEDQWLDGSYEE